ncbi:hypothetical protein [Helicobacter felis]|uniref:hypothetical protein n=1 Tax=Helicobacter felis TaxID=214 RepID=UPI001F2B72E5|nr:hypothetical protein [Helicobacter felis]
MAYGDLYTMQFEGYKNWGLSRSEAQIINGDVSTALKIALMRAQRKITNSLYPEILISFKNQQISCC